MTAKTATLMPIRHGILFCRTWWKIVPLLRKRISAKQILGNA